MSVMVAWLAGCMPAGPRALLKGKRLLDEGKNAEAIEELKVATSLLATNAQAWNYLGLAYHHAGQAADAVEAYQRALSLNHDLVAVHYNLGCLLLEQNRPDTLEGARNELTAFVVRQGNVTDGWLKLGTAQLRLGQVVQAEISFKNALQLSPGNPEALNDLGMVQLQRRRTRDAAVNFSNALKQQPNYAPALLNLAVTEIYLNNRPLALQKYEEYLALSPRPSNWDAVNSAAQQLDEELNPPPRPAPTNNLVAVNPITNNVTPPPPTLTNAAHVETNLTAVKPLPAPTIVSTPATRPPPILPVSKPEVVQLPDGPAIKTADNGTMAPEVTAMGPEGDTAEPPAVTPKPQKRGFFQRLNPMGLFRHDSKPAVAPEPRTTPLPVTPPASNDSVSMIADSAVAVPEPKPVRTISLARYPYLSPTPPEAGNRTEAERLLGKGGEAQRDHRMADAIAWYRSATQADPSDFDAQQNLGLATLDAGNLAESLRAFELALAINPDSFNARYYFGLALKKANYVYDAVQELEKLLVANPAGTSSAQLALVHLTLGNLYSEQFHQVASAKTHYLKVLELDPHNSQATAIRYWLQNNP